ncbi:MAG: hypothetical protein OEN01_16210, partial [Candidatus Krumholzibacteria bacterium]|nr:hypothetical protein [Candidatus Krumholzibacteria bacterium]
IVTLIEVKTLLLEQGSKVRSPRVMSGMLGGHVSAYFVGSLIDQADRFQPDTLHRYLQNLRWADFKLKTSSISPRSILETALIASSARKELALYAN